MAKGRDKKKSARGLADPTTLAPFGDDHTLMVIIETPKGSRNKYAFDEKEKIFSLKHVLPAGMAFPYDFGFVPGTMSGDGDPLDVLVLMDEPAFAGCRVECRIVGVIQGEQEGKKGPVRNDRIVAVAQDNHSYAHVKKFDDLGNQFTKELGDFFVNYHRLSGKKFRIIGVKGPSHGAHCVESAQKLARRG